MQTPFHCLLLESLVESDRIHYAVEAGKRAFKGAIHRGEEDCECRDSGQRALKVGGVNPPSIAQKITNLLILPIPFFSSETL